MDKIQAEAICELIVSDINGGKISPRDAWIKHLLPLQSQPPAAPEPRGNALWPDAVKRAMDWARSSDDHDSPAAVLADEVARLRAVLSTQLLASSQGQGVKSCAGCIREGFQDAEPTCHECVRFDEPVPDYASDFFEAHPQPSGLREAASVGMALRLLFDTCVSLFTDPEWDQYGRLSMDCGTDMDRELLLNAMIFAQSALASSQGRDRVVKVKRMPDLHGEKSYTDGLGNIYVVEDDSNPANAHPQPSGLRDLLDIISDALDYTIDDGECHTCGVDPAGDNPDCGQCGWKYRARAALAQADREEIKNG